MTRFAFEVPLKHLNDFDEDQDYLFSLSFLFEKSEEYEIYHLQSGKIHILDNSFNELGAPTPVVEMVRLFNHFNPEYIISPDGDHMTPDELIGTYGIIASLVGPKTTIPVARTLEEIRRFQALQAAYIAIPYEHRLAIYLPEGQNYHFLGLNNLNEILAYKPHTCDTSMPLKLALNGWTISDWVMKGCPHIHTKDIIGGPKDFFQMKMTAKQIDLSKRNINFLKEVCNVHGRGFNGIQHFSLTNS